MGPLPGILGALMALEALRILGGLPAALLGRRLTFQGRVFSFREDPLPVSPHCSLCQHLLPGAGLGCLKRASSI